MIHIPLGGWLHGTYSYMGWRFLFEKFSSYFPYFWGFLLFSFNLEKLHSQLPSLTCRRRRYGIILVAVQQGQWGSNVDKNYYLNAIPGMFSLPNHISIG